MKKFTLGFIGGGRITRIFLQASKNKSINLENVTVYEPDAGNMDRLLELFPEIKAAGSPEMAAKQEVVILAIHPPVVMDTLSRIKEFVNASTIILSLAPKFTTAKIAEVLPARKIVRMIPNATSFSNDGYNPVAFGREFPVREKKSLIEIFSHLGETFEVEENKLEAYAVYSAMLPTYFWFQWKKLEELAVYAGFTPNEASGMLKATLNRSVGLMYDSGLTYEEVVDLIPVKPIGEHEAEIRNIYETRLTGLLEKIKP